MSVAPVVPLYVGAQAGDAGDFIADRMLSPAGYIGTTPTALVGRAGDLARLAAVLACPDAGLVTVTGPAGVGKSRLVMEYFRQHPPGPGRPVDVLDFGQVADAAVLGRVVRELNEQRERGSRAARAALERIGEGRHTVVLDHCEDVAGELAPLLAEFRRCCPQVRVVTVGTTRLGLYGERVVRLQPLPPGDAADLFAHCARSVLPEFTLTPENSRPVLALCELLGGLPFAIELAALQAKLAGPELILERLKAGFGDLYRIGHHPYSRHSNIGDLISWVAAHLDSAERMLLNQLAIFEGPFAMCAAAEVVPGFDGGGYRTMERLIDKSVLIPEQRPGGELSLSIPNVLRLDAARTLSGLPCYPALRQAHGDYFRRAATAGTARAADMRADLVAAFGYWRDAGEGPAMAVIADALRGSCTEAGEAWQCLRMATEVLRVGAGEPRLHARTLEAAGEIAARLDFAAARGYLTRARDAYRAAHDKDGVVRCLRLLGDEAYASGDLNQARRWFEQSLAALGGAGPDAGAGPAEAFARAAAARRLLTRRLAVALREAGSLTEAGILAQAALAAELGRNDATGSVLARYVLATIGWLQHDSAAARALFADAAEQLGGLPDVPEQPECLELLAITLWKWRRITDWERLTAALALAGLMRERLGSGRPEPLNEMIAPILAAASQGLTAAEYAKAWQAGTELPWAGALRLIPRDGEPASMAGTGIPADVTDVLTKRELEIALLVAEGLTSRVIAHQLGIAEWTVVNHLRKVMRKLGCQSRVQVARRVAVSRL